MFERGRVLLFLLTVVVSSPGISRGVVMVYWWFKLLVVDRVVCGLSRVGVWVVSGSK